jgi:hypothetical protein
MPKKIIKITRTAGDTLSAADPAGLAADPTGYGLPGDTVHTVNAAYKAWSDVLANDVIAYNAAHWHDPSPAGKIINANADYVEKSGVIVTAYGSNTLGHRAGIDQGTWLTAGGPSWTLLSNSAPDDVKFCVKGSTGSIVEGTHFQPGTFWLKMPTTVKAVINHVCRDAVNSGYLYANRSIGASLRRYEVYLERKKSVTGLNGMGADKGRWASARYPVGSNQVDWGHKSTRGLAPGSGVQCYLFVCTGNDSYNPTHAQGLGGLYVTSPTSDTFGVMVRDVTGNIIERLHLRGCNNTSISVVANNANLRNVRIRDNLVSHHAGYAFLVDGKKTTAKVIFEVAGEYMLDGNDSDTRWSSAAEPYDYVTEVDGNAQAGWEQFKVTGYTEGVRQRASNVLSSAWHHAWALPAGVGNGTSYPGKSIVVTDSVLTAPQNIGDSRVASVGGVERWVLRNLTCDGHFQRSHVGGTLGLTENSLWKNPNGGGTIPGEPGETRALWDITNFGQVQYVAAGGGPTLASVGAHTVWRHDVIDERNSPAGRVSFWRLEGAFALALPLNGLDINNMIFIVEPNASGGGYERIFMLHYINGSGSSKREFGNQADWRSAACGMAKQRFCNNVTLVDRSLAGAETSPIRAAWRSMCFRTQATGGLILPLTTEYRDMLDTAFAGMTKPYDSGVAFPWADGTGNRVMWLQDAGLDSNYRPASPTSPLVYPNPLGRRFTTGDHHDDWIWDRDGKVRGTGAEGSATAPTPGMYEKGSASPTGYGFGTNFGNNWTHFAGAAGSIVNDATAGSITVTAGASNSQQANTHVLWCKTKPIAADYCFSFDYTWLDGFTSTTSGGIFTQFIFGYRGTGAHPANPNDWSTADWQGGNSEIDPPNDDNTYAENGKGLRASFNTRNSMGVQPPDPDAATNKARLRAYNEVTSPVTIDPEQGCVIEVNKKYKVWVRVLGDKASLRVRHPDTGVEQTAEWVSPYMLTHAAGNWIGLRFGSGRSCRVANFQTDAWPSEVVRPILDGIDPSTAVEGGANPVPMTVAGRSLKISNRVRWNDGSTVAELATTYVAPVGATPAYLRATIPVDKMQVADPNTATITIYDSVDQVESLESLTFTLTVAPAENAPVISAMVPSTTYMNPTRAAGLSLTGLNFRAGQTVKIGAFAPLTPWVSPTGGWFVRVPQSYLTAAGDLSVIVNDPVVGDSLPATLTVVSGGRPSYSTPEQTTISPTGCAVNTPAVDLYAYGTSVSDGDYIRWGGDASSAASPEADETTQFQQLDGSWFLHRRVTTLLDEAGARPVRIKRALSPLNNSPAGIDFVVEAAPVRTPTIGALSQSTAVAAPGSILLTITGTNFNDTSQTVQVDGVDVAATNISESIWEASVDISVADTYAIRIHDTVNGDSVPVDFVVTAPLVPAVITSLSAYTANVGATPFTLTIGGSGFAGDQTLLVNGASRAWSAQTAISIDVAITTDDLASAAPLTFHLTDPETGASNSMTLDVVVQPEPDPPAPPPHAMMWFKRATVQAPGPDLSVPTESPLVQLINPTTTTIDVVLTNVDGANSYSIYVSTDGLIYGDPLTGCGTFTVLIDLTPGQLYYVRATADNANGSGPMSTSASESTAAE